MVVELDLESALELDSELGQQLDSVSDLLLVLALQGLLVSLLALAFLPLDMYCKSWHTSVSKFQCTTAHPCCTAFEALHTCKASHRSSTCWGGTRPHNHQVLIVVLVIVSVLALEVQGAQALEQELDPWQHIVQTGNVQNHLNRKFRRAYDLQAIHSLSSH